MSYANLLQVIIIQYSVNPTHLRLARELKQANYFELKFLNIIIPKENNVGLTYLKLSTNLNRSAKPI